MLGLDLRIIFLVLLIGTAIVFALVNPQPVFNLGQVWTILLHFLLVPLAVGTVLVFFLILTRTDPMNLLLRVSQRISGRFNVSFLDATAHLDDSVNVISVSRQDTDGDDFAEWVVFYQFDLQTSNSPIYGAIYDNDRGNPPIIFPYQLRVPDRDYLSEGKATLEFTQIPAEDTGIQEILVKGDKELSIFRYNEENKSEEWQPPKDAPKPVYEPIGFFRGSGGVNFDDTTGTVTVIDRDPFERSQLALRSIYDYSQEFDSYFQTPAPILVPPTIETVDFFKEPPENIFETSFPEKVVLAFYAATCGSSDLTLCRHASNIDWNPGDFLTPVADCNQEPDTARCEFNRGNANYFGLNRLSGTSNIQVSRLRYYPQIEDSSFEVNYAGKVPRGNCVEIRFGNPRSGLDDTYFYKMRLVEGQWKIDSRISDFSLCGEEFENASDAAIFAPPSSQSLPPLGPPHATRVTSD